MKKSLSLGLTTMMLGVLAATSFGAVAHAGVSDLQPPIWINRS